MFTVPQTEIDHSHIVFFFVFSLYHFYHAAIAIKISNLLICFCSFDFSCPILEKDSFVENLYIVLNSVIF